MAAKKPALAVDGIELNVKAEDLDDFDLVEALADANSEDMDVQMQAVVRVFRIVYGDDYKRVKSELREKNGGKLTTEIMMGFFGETMEALGAKN